MSASSTGLSADLEEELLFVTLLERTEVALGRDEAAVGALEKDGIVTEADSPLGVWPFRSVIFQALCSTEIPLMLLKRKVEKLIRKYIFEDGQYTDSYREKT
jgi:hypothetical protein